jgi:hypothetical protein
MHLILDVLQDGLSYQQALGIQADWYEDEGYPLAAAALRLPRGRLATKGGHALDRTTQGRVVAWGDHDREQDSFALTPEGRVVAWGVRCYERTLR